MTTDPGTIAAQYGLAGLMALIVGCAHATPQPLVYQALPATMLGDMGVRLFFHRPSESGCDYPWVRPAVQCAGLVFDGCYWRCEAGQ